MIEEKVIKRFSMLVIALVFAILTFLVLRPVILAIFTGLLLAYIFYPLYKRLLRILPSRTLAAILMCLLVLLLIFLPIWFITPVIVKQVFNIYSSAKDVNFFSIIKDNFPYLFTSQTLSTEINTALNNFISKFANFILAEFSDLILNLPTILIQMLIIFSIFFFTLRDAKKLAEYMRTLSPLNKELEQNLIQQFKDISFGVIYGQIIVGIVQGTLTGIGLIIFGVPQALVLTVLAIFLAIIPFLGAYFVWVPAAIILLISGKTTAGFGLIIYGLIVVSWIDNIIRPYIVSRRAKIHSVVVFVGMIGGLIVFGVLGLFLGPLILAYLLLIIDLYKQKKLFA